jgi:hypothetical protein
VKQTHDFSTVHFKRERTLLPFRLQELRLTVLKQKQTLGEALFSRAIYSDHKQQCKKERLNLLQGVKRSFLA